MKQIIVLLFAEERGVDAHARRPGRVYEEAADHRLVRTLIPRRAVHEQWFQHRHTEKPGRAFEGRKEQDRQRKGDQVEGGSPRFCTAGIFLHKM